MTDQSRPRIHPTVVLSDDAEIGADVRIGPFSMIHPGVTIGDGSVIGSHCVIGEPTAEHYQNAGAPVRPCVIGPKSVVRSHTIIYEGATLGTRFECGHRVTIREGSLIGDGVRVGTMSDLQGDLVIGDYVRLHSNVHVGRLTWIEDFCWIFPFVVFTNDPHPPSDTCTRGGHTKRFAVVATNTVVMPGVTIGEHALVGAMSLVTRDVPDMTVVLGVPAKAVGPITDVKCRHDAGAPVDVYPWPEHFHRGYPDGALPNSISD